MAKAKISRTEVQEHIYQWVKIVVLKTLKDKNLSHLNHDILISAGLYGYTQARRRFSPDRGAKFKTYVEHRIRGAVLDEVRKLIGDERRKTPLPKKVYDYDFENVGDGNEQQRMVEGNLDLSVMWKHVKYSLSDHEIKILQCRVEGLTLKEIAEKYNIKEDDIAFVLSKVKKDASIYFQDYIDDSFKIKEFKCPYCRKVNEMQEGARNYDCEHCGRAVKVKSDKVVL
jgi:RNA polymerase sigma factor (sigma-70 family)